MHSAVRTDGPADQEMGVMRQRKPGDLNELQAISGCQVAAGDDTPNFGGCYGRSRNTAKRLGDVVLAYVLQAFANVFSATHLVTQVKTNPEKRGPKQDGRYYCRHLFFSLTAVKLNQRVSHIHIVSGRRC